MFQKCPSIHKMKFETLHEKNHKPLHNIPINEQMQQGNVSTLSSVTGLRTHGKHAQDPNNTEALS